MNCLFCPNRPLKGVSAYYRSCSKCTTNYDFHIQMHSSDPDRVQPTTVSLWTYSFRTVYKGRVFIATFDVDYKTFCIEALVGSYSKEMIMRLDELPNITPYNFYNKLSKLIVFS